MISKKEYLKAKKVVEDYESNDFPKFPSCRVIKEGCGKFCSNCDSTISRDGFLGIFGELLCHNSSCVNSKSKIKKS